MDVGSEGTVEMIGSILAEADGLNELETAGWERTGGEVAPPGLGGLVGRAHVSGGLGGPHPQRLARGAVRGGRRLERGRGGRGQRDVGGWVGVGGGLNVCVCWCVSHVAVLLSEQKDLNALHVGAAVQQVHGLVQVVLTSQRDGQLGDASTQSARVPR